MPINDLDKYFILHKTDKASTDHNYSVPYFMFFNSVRNSPIKLLEFGIYKGASVKAWKDFFPSATIVGVDIDAQCRQYEEERIHVEIGDMTNGLFLNDLHQKYGGFDIIIDDAAHFWRHQIEAFHFMFPLLNPGGFYSIEDLHTSYLFGSVYDTGRPTTVEVLNDVINQLHLNGKSSNGVKEIGNKPLTYYENWLEYMFLFKGICIMKKRNSPLR